MNVKSISIGRNPPDDINVIIEISLYGHPVKYEMDKKAEVLFVDRFISTPMLYPGNYGFVPHTCSDDGDPIDVLIYNTEPLFPGSVINVRPIGVMIMEDNSGKDEKILAVPSDHVTTSYKKIQSYKDIPEIDLKKIEHFFRHYKDLEEGKWVKIDQWKGIKDAHNVILAAIERYSE
ncbi:Inorganic pyrophosphatase [Liberibacter crescens BT-1]|uniref:Inorganic pyrophosphatase n=1 Tax=Liberibacter crescens (strain BT-1) TaxID=1215343 RepID=L0EVQ5_LIBCB|nr:inorganic diphosphatase [Liberibacter crescens]AGA65012.1 Inorganic pyrophosphatase [Liberibacter crescens BT-1]AMC13020.1 inorganic pyrophosphatase [Liberibacter crescens]